MPICMMEESGALLIRAVQGHSVKLVQEDELLDILTADQVDLPEQCVHGTYPKDNPCTNPTGFPQSRTKVGVTDVVRYKQGVLRCSARGGCIPFVCHLSTPRQGIHPPWPRAVKTQLGWV